jgi:hypothetical protein
LGINSDEPIYKLSWNLNQRIKINLTVSDSIVNRNAKTGEVAEFLVFDHNEYPFRIRLISNIDCGKSTFLFKELRHFNYLLQFEGDWDEGEIAYMIHCVKKTEIVRLVSPVDVNHLHGKAKLFYL